MSAHFLFALTTLFISTALDARDNECVVNILYGEHYIYELDDALAFAFS